MHWARSLLGQAKQPMLRFHQTEGMLLSTAGKEAVCRYVELARRLRAFEVSLFERWLKETEHLLPTYIHRPLLCPANAVIMNQGYVITEGSEKIQWLLQWEENGWPEGLALNFAAQLQEVITEVKQLEQLGFDFPELARNVALQEDEYHRTIQELQQIVKRYNQVFNRLSDPENKLLHHHVSELRRKLRPGLFRLNWSSLAIPDYLTCCHNALSNFELLLNQVQRSAENILSNLHLIESANLFKFQTSSGKNDLPDVNEFFKMTAQQREADVEQLVCAWWEVSPLLMKIESLVVGSSTGCSPALADYYSHWEKQAYKSLVTMVFREVSMENRAAVSPSKLVEIKA
uniref:Dynein heavy chain tail domain-containing protein n=1 Tax=Eptatretus burgeri TaxID=7764 RepID=A0A8C4QEU2_EPTBU